MHTELKNGYLPIEVIEKMSDQEMEKQRRLRCEWAAQNEVARKASFVVKTLAPDHAYENENIKVVYIWNYGADICHIYWRRPDKTEKATVYITGTVPRPGPWIWDLNRAYHHAREIEERRKRKLHQEARKRAAAELSDGWWLHESEMGGMIG